MPQRHFHVDVHDIGYLPNPDGVSTHLTIDGALDDATTLAEEMIDQLSRLDPEEPIRGQTYMTTPVTNKAEIEALDVQVESILNAISTNEEYAADIARKGLLIIVDDGVAVIELTPCSEDSCETYRKNWIE